MVHVSGRMKSNHTTKQAAKNAAREYANEGDTLEIRRTDGSVQERSCPCVQLGKQRWRGRYLCWRAILTAEFGEEAYQIGVEGFFK